MDENGRIQWLNRHFTLSGCDLLTEREQAQDEGRDLRSVEKAFDRLLAVEGDKLDGRRDVKWLADAEALLDRVQALPIRKEYRYGEPSDLAGIRKVRPKCPALKPWKCSRAEWLRRLHGGWLGRIAGCLLGKPVEGAKRAEIRTWAEVTGNWPLTGYWKYPTPAQEKAIKARGFTRGFGDRSMMVGGIRGMVEDDDTNYTATGFAILKEFGAGFTPQDVATFWGQNIPIFHTFTAEQVAYRNLAMGIPPPASARFRNPYREWIGAQIRADYFGYANPGDPERAAEWAWRDASISHVRNGIYGEMWVAAMLAAAYVERDWVAVIRAGLAQVPRKCRLREDVEAVITLNKAGVPYEDAVERFCARWDETVRHHWCHTLSNAQLVAMGLLYGEDDYGRTIARSIMPGFDTDCNGATCGSLWGVKHGVDALPAAWIRPLRDRLATGVAGYHEVRISRMAEEMIDLAIRLRKG